MNCKSTFSLVMPFWLFFYDTLWYSSHTLIINTHKRVNNKKKNGKSYSFPTDVYDGKRRKNVKIIKVGK